MQNVSAMDRRTFVAGAAATAAATVLAGATAHAARAEETGEPEVYDIAETVDVDVVVVGAGISGFAAAVESAELGGKVLLLEKLATLGGDGSYTFGPSGFNTRYSKALGIELDPREACIEEQHVFNFIPNCHFYLDMAEASSDNIDWVVDHGVVISDIVDNFKGGNPTAHYWGEHGGEVDPVNGRRGYGYVYTEGMTAACEKLGVEIRTECPAIDIIKDGDAVVGVIAQNAAGEYIQVNAKAVILGTGGICGSKELMARMGRTNEALYPWTFCPGCTGDGYTLAMKAGAFDMFRNVGFIEQPCFAEMGLAENKAREEGLGMEYFPNRNDNHPIYNIIKYGKCIWVNEEGERFADECCAHPDGGVAMWATAAFESQIHAFAFFDNYVATELLGQECMDFLMGANDYNTKFTGETVEEIAEAMGVPADKLQATIDRYNEMVAEGKDSDFGKREDALLPIGDGPYYATYMCSTPTASFGGVRINRNMQAADIEWKPIPGLYVVGVDSFPFYTQIYYYQLPGSAVAFELHSGLVAARHAAANR